MQGTGSDEEGAFHDARDAAFRGGSVIVRSSWAQTPPTMTRAAWEALSDPDAPLLGDDLPALDEEDGSTLWTVCVERLSAEYGPGLVARIDVPAFGSGNPFRVMLTEIGATVFEGMAQDALDAMERADTEAQALGWRQGQVFPTARP